MSVTELTATTAQSLTKRKRDLAELEVDVNAEEPPSKKALRKAKKAKFTGQRQPAEDIPLETSQDDTEHAQREQRPKKSKTVKAVKEIDAFTNQARSGFGIWIGNLAFQTAREDLMTFLTSDHENRIDESEITRIHMPSGPPKMGKPQNKGFAYVDFVDEDTLHRGLALSEKLLGGRRVLIKDAKSYEGRPANKQELASGKPPSRRIFVGNLPFDTTAESLEEHFGACGNITKTQLATFEDSGKCKGYGWVEFEDMTASRTAMRGWLEHDAGGGVRLHKKRIWLNTMDSRKLRMEYAEDSAFRYQKRFGKEAKMAESGNADAAKDDQAADKEQRSARQDKSTHLRSQTSQRYGQQTVQRLTGAITESEGKKVVFD